MIRAAAALLMISACAYDSYREYRYECGTIRTCDDVERTSTLVVIGTEDEARGQIQEWVDGCQREASYDVRSGTCGRALCGMHCVLTDGPAR